MRPWKLLLSLCIGLALGSWESLDAEEASIGQVKSVAGEAALERGGVSRPVQLGDRLYTSDVLTTGAAGRVGITFVDNSLMSLGPDGRLSLDAFRFDTTTHEGVFESSLSKGTLSVKSGDIARQKPEAMRVKTPAALLGVRGTEFVVRADAGRD